MTKKLLNYHCTDCGIWSYSLHCYQVFLGAYNVPRSHPSKFMLLQVLILVYVVLLLYFALSLKPLKAMSALFL